MNNKNRLNRMTAVIAALFLLSLFSGIAAAQNPGEQYEKAKLEYQKHKDRYDDALKKFEAAKDLFEKANAKFKNARDNESKEELTLRAKEYLERAINLTDSHLEVLKYRVELSENNGVIPFDASKVIDSHIGQLEQLRTKVQQASTIQELITSHKELKDMWVKIRLETRYYFEILLDNKIGNFLLKADNVSVKVDAAIQNMTSQGKDTGKLEKKAADYKNYVEEAKDNQKETKGLLAAHNGFASDGTVTDNKNAEAFLRQVDGLQKETINKLKAASKQLIDFVREYKILSGKSSINGEEKSESRGGKTTVGNMAVTVTVTPG